MSQRDRLILAGATVIALVGAFWLLALAPKRRDLHKLDNDVQKSEQSYQSARADAQRLAEARLQFPSAYTSLVRLGKAVPASADVPSLLVQLNQAASSAGVDFRTISLNTTQSGTAPTPAPAASTTPPASSSSSASGSGTTGAQGSTSSSAQSGTSSSTTGAQDANALTAATLPIGATVGPAGLPTLRFNFSFQGSFFKMANLIHNIRKLVARRNRNLIVSGRLLTIDGIALSEGDFGFPKVKASIAATAYLVPASQGLLDGATSQAPDGASTAAATPASASTGSTTPPAAVVTP